jgi:hypothetical protein
MASRWCLDLWYPLEDWTPEQAIAHIHPLLKEQVTGYTPASHLITDYVLSRNIARYGLKYTTLIEVYKQVFKSDLKYNPWLWHEYNISQEQKLADIKAALVTWGLAKPEPLKLAVGKEAAS